MTTGVSTFVAYGVLLAVAPLTTLHAQPAKSIEVASVRPSGNTIAESNLDSVPGRLTATNITVRELIRFAYGLKDFQIQSAPKCVDSARFDIVAKTAGGQASGLDDEKSLVREFLGDRFQLRSEEHTSELQSH